MNCSVRQFKKTGGAKDPHLPVGWMVNHQDVQEGERDPGDVGEEEEEALEGEGWVNPTFLPKGWTVRRLQFIRKMEATTALISRSVVNVTSVSICWKEKNVLSSHFNVKHTIA